MNRLRPTLSFALFLSFATSSAGCSHQDQHTPAPAPTSTTPSTSAPTSTAPPELGLPWLQTSGTNFVTGNGTSVRLTGVELANAAWGQWVPGVSDALAAQNQDPMIRPTELYPWVLTDADFDVLKALPLSIVRYDINYELFAADNPKLDANLSALRANAQRFGSLGVYVIINLMMPLGLDVQSDVYERSKPGNQREASLFESDTFFQGNLDMWKRVATCLKDLPEVAGYELINEPRRPSDADGGLDAYKTKLTALATGIREVDPKHIVFVPEYNSREANPGESYWNVEQNKLVIAQGEQGIIWDRGFVAVEVPNVAYVFHLYDPWEYTSNGASSFDASAVEQVVASKVSFRDTLGHAPLIVTEYGVNRQQTPDKRVAWLDTVHDLFRKNGIAATYFTYKASVDPYVPASTVFALYGQFVTRDQYVTTEAGAEVLRSDVRTVAAQNGFDSLFTSYFTGQPSTFLSPLDNAPVIESLRRFGAP